MEPFSKEPWTYMDYYLRQDYATYHARTKLTHEGKHWETDHAAWPSWTFFPAVLEAPLGKSMARVTMPVIVYSKQPLAGHERHYDTFKHNPILNIQHNLHKHIDPRSVRDVFNNIFAQRQPMPSTYITMIVPDQYKDLKITGHSWAMSLLATTAGLPPFYYSGLGFQMDGEFQDPNLQETKHHGIEANKGILFTSDSDFNLPPMRRTYEVNNMAILFEMTWTLINEPIFIAKYKLHPIIGSPPGFLQHQPWEERRIAFDTAINLNLTGKQFLQYHTALQSLLHRRDKKTYYSILRKGLTGVDWNALFEAIVDTLGTHQLGEYSRKAVSIWDAIQYAPNRNTGNTTSLHWQ